MAYVTTRKNAAGAITSWQVKWREGGSRNGPQQSERFDDEPSATVFRDAVNDCGQHWPPGWVKGQGFIDQSAAQPAHERYRFRNFARESIAGRTGVEEHYRADCLRDLERWILPTFSECDVRSTEHFSSDTVRAWVRKLEQAKVHKGQRPKTGEPKWRPMSPKTIRNLHGLLSSILQEAVKAEPPLRARNPCELTHLPRADDDGADGIEDIEFLTPEEVEGVIECMDRRSDQLLARIKYGTGLRWSEVTALGPVSLEDWHSARPRLRVKRSWKRDGRGGYYLGAPKSKRGRRSLRVSTSVVEAVEELGGPARESEDAGRMYFTGEQGQRLHYSTFYDRWQRAVKRAKAQGLLPQYKSPTPHDLRHSHASVLISEGRGLTYVQRRLGHESITTTSDTYGHLLPEADDDAMDAIERSLGRGRDGADQAVVAERQDRSRVHVVHLTDTHLVAFWERADAHATAEQWQLDTGQSARVETWAADWWRRQHGNGVKDVRDALPGRARIWMMSGLYGADGSLLRTGVPQEQGAVQWVWEWDERYTEGAATKSVEYAPGPVPLTRVQAWGVDEAAVREAFTEACAQALRICALHPGLHGNGDKVPN